MLFLVRPWDNTPQPLPRPSGQFPPTPLVYLRHRQGGDNSCVIFCHHPPSCHWFSNFFSPSLLVLLPKAKFDGTVSWVFFFFFSERSSTARFQVSGVAQRRSERIGDSGLQGCWARNGSRSGTCAGSTVNTCGVDESVLVQCVTDCRGLVACRVCVWVCRLLPWWRCVDRAESCSHSGEDGIYFLRRQSIATGCRFLKGDQVTWHVLNEAAYGRWLLPTQAGRRQEFLLNIYSLSSLPYGKCLRLCFHYLTNVRFVFVTFQTSWQLETLAGGEVRWKVW